MKEIKVITMKSEMNNETYEHICSENVHNSENVYNDSENVNYNYDDYKYQICDDSDYDSDYLHSFYHTDEKPEIHSGSNKLPKKNKRSNKKKNYLDEDEEEYSEDEEDDNFNENDNDEDRQIKHAIYIRQQNEKIAKDLDKLEILKDKLKWVDEKKIQILSDSSVNLNFKEYPAIEKTIDAKKLRVKNRSSKSKTLFASPISIKYRPCKHIEVIIGNSTYIGMKSPATKNIICKRVLRGEECKFGNQCIFSHNTEQAQINKLCNSIKEGKECKFGDKCKFLHILQTEKKIQKPDCKYGVKCGNKKCTFIHPNGKKLQGNQNHQTTSNEPITSAISRSSSRSTQSIYSESSSKENEIPLRKIWFCKNMFKITLPKVQKAGEPANIEKSGICRFGDSCIYAHSIEEIKQNLEKCKFEENCKNIKIIQIIKNDKKVRRYENISETRKCNRLHPKERVIDFITRLLLQKS